MDDWHRQDVGRSFGPNPFQNGAYTPMPIKATEEQKIQELNTRLGFIDESSLPHFEQALGWVGHNPQSLLSHSKCRGQNAPQFSENSQLVLQVA